MSNNKTLLTQAREDKECFWTQCPRNGCGYQWYYTGKLKFHATCPQCRRVSKIVEVDK